MSLSLWVKAHPNPVLNVGSQPWSAKVQILTLLWLQVSFEDDHRQRSVCVCIYMFVLKRKPVAEGRIKNRSLKSQVNLNHWITFSLCVNATRANRIQTRARFTGEVTLGTIIHVCMCVRI